MIGIVGTGFVGNSIYEGIKDSLTVFAYDKAKGWKTNCPHGLPHALNDNKPDEAMSQMTQLLDGPVFVCVPTPMNRDGSCNTDIVEDVIRQLSEGYQCTMEKLVVVIKSTVVPGTTDRLNAKYANLSICFNPEFLTEKNAVEDFKNQDRIIVGGPPEAVKLVREVYFYAFPGVPFFETTATAAEMVKYVTNCFLATKVSFANEISQISEALGVDYNEVIKLATKDKRLGQSHWAVPGPMPADDGTGRLLKGFAGSCFVKDINALMRLAKEIGVDPMVMDGAWGKNLEVRPERDWENLKGRAVSDSPPSYRRLSVRDAAHKLDEHLRKNVNWLTSVGIDETAGQEMIHVYTNKRVNNKEVIILKTSGWEGYPVKVLNVGKIKPA